MPFSLRERDRRWSQVRSLMESAGITILLLTDAASTRYLTQVDDPHGATVFLLDGDPTVFLDANGDLGVDNIWASDIRTLDEWWAVPIIDRLRELGGDRAIVGVTGLDAQLRVPEGTLNYNSFVMMREWLNHARWVGARALLREATAVKSAEEIVVLRQAAAAAEAGLDAILALHPDGLSELELWATAEAAMTRAGATSPHQIRLTRPMSSAAPPVTKPARRALAARDLVVLELCARCEGYAAPLIQPAADPMAARLDAWRILQQTWDRCWRQLRPGAPLDTLATPRVEGSYRGEVSIEGIGLGDDLPWVEAGVIRGTSMAGAELHEGEAFLLRLTLTWTDGGADYRLSAGSTVTLSAGGAEEIGRRPAQIIDWG